MSESLTATPEDVTPGKNQRFDDVVVWVHWITLALVVAQFLSAWLVSAAAGADQAGALLRLHRSLGIFIWLVTVSRLAWRLLVADLPPFPESMPKLQRQMAKLNEYGLYALLIIQPLTGLAYSLFRGRSFPIFLWQMPKLLPGDRGLSEGLHSVHQIGAVVLLLLIGVHALAGLFHRFILRDNVLQRMLPTGLSGQR
jgi:superoxide oxidase